MSPRTLLTLLSCALVAPLFADPNGHAEDDAFWADAAALLPGFEGTPDAPGPSSQDGSWGSVLPWPHTPVSISHLPNGRVLTFSGQEPQHWPGTKTQTHWAIWNPATGAFENDLYLNHEMFCAHLVLRTDGTLQTMGGRYTVRDSSTYDWRDNQWGRIRDMFDRRWYTTSVALPDGDVFTVSGSGGPNTAERYEPETDTWQRLGGIDWQPVAGATEGFEQNWWPYVFVAPDGRLFHFGPTREMHWVSPDGNGSRTSAALQVPGNYFPKHAGVVMYASGKFLVAGGAVNEASTTSNKCYTVDLNTSPPTVALTASMRYPRRFQNAIVLPTGEVLIVGGNTSGRKFSDLGTVLTPEIWNPTTGTWRELADHSIPRNYHSTALLLPDGRVFSGGGGYSSGNPNASSTHTDAQLFTPPSLFRANGIAAPRPELNSAPDGLTLGSVFQVRATAGLRRFSMIRMMASTHGLSTDQRFLDIPFSEDTPGEYRLVAHPNANVMVPGYWMLFGLDAVGAYSEAKIIHVKETGDAPTSGLAATYHNGINLSSPQLTRTDATVDFNYNTGTPLRDLVGPDTWSTEWTGWIVPDFTETHTFFTNSDDGVRLWVGDQLLIDNWTLHAPTENSGSIALTAGVPVPVRLEHYQQAGGAVIQLSWSSPRTPKSIIPARNLRAANPENEAVLAADNRHELFINGELVAIGADWRQALRTAFSTGARTTLAIRATDSGDVAGVIGQFRVNGETVPTNASWKVSTTAPDGWEQPGFNDSSWSAATEYGPLGAAPWGDDVSGLPPGTNARWIWSADRENDNQVFLRLTLGAPDFLPVADRVSTTGQSVSFTPALSSGDLSGLTFAASGLPAGLTIDSSTGRISGTPTTQGVRTVTLSLRENTSTLATATFTWTVRLPGQGEGSFLREVWTDIPGSLLPDITENPRFPASPDLTELATAFPVGRNSADAYGTRLRGYIHAPVTGSYVFWLSTDDAGSLLLSTDDSPDNAREIASIPLGWAAVNEWEKHPTQTSAAIPLTGGRRYYFEILQKEGAGGDHINLAWQRPGDTERLVVESSYLSPFETNEPPTLVAIPDQSHTVGAALTLRASAADPDGDSLVFAASGLPAGLLLDPDSGEIFGSPVTPGAFEVTLTATDPSGEAASTAFLWTVQPALEVSPLRAWIISTNDTGSYTLDASGGTAPTFRWNFGDGSPDLLTPTPEASHTFTRPGRFTITVTALDGGGGASQSQTFTQTVRPSIIGGAPTHSSPILTLPGSVWTVNPDHGSISVLDTGTGARLAELATGRNPRALALGPADTVWVANKGSDTLSVIDITTLTLARTIPLPRGSAPAAIVFAPDGSAAFVSLEAAGMLHKLDPATGALLAAAPAGPHPRHLSIGHDGSSLFVSRFISPPVPGESGATPSPDQGGGEVLHFRTADLTALDTIVLAPSREPDSGGGGRGVPNYLGPAVISPAGDFAWVPSKQDNIQRGTLRDGRDLTHDSTVRAISSLIDLGTLAEIPSARIDHDDASMPSAALFDPTGLLLFVAFEGSQEVAVVDVYARAEIFRFPVGHAPQGLTLSQDGGVLFVHNYLDRSVSLHAIGDLFLYGSEEAPHLATLGTTSSEILEPEILLGKRLFHDARDNRMSSQDYISCASCHNEGGHDGRVWDFTGFGEGLRNTTDLRGRAGTGHGPVHWTGNFDEIQDFENQLLDLAGGDGLLTAGSPHPPLGPPNAGRSADLDALAAYVTSLSSFAPTPHREPSGDLTPAAARGRELFIAADCASCHSGENFTDSGGGLFHDIGTLTPASGARLGELLTGIDTPTLRGLHDGAPFLHDGSAATLSEAIAAHQGVSFSTADLDDLVAYLLQIDDSEESAPAPIGPVIQRFTATPAILAPGDSTTLTWQILDGGSALTALTLNGTDVLGTTSLTLSPAATTTYTLVATNPSGSATATRTVEVGLDAPEGSWEAWLLDYGLPNDPIDDSDADALPAAIEFALGLDPTRGDYTAATTPGADPLIPRGLRLEAGFLPDGSRHFDLVFTRPLATPTGVSYWLEASAELASGWTTVADLSTTPAATDPEAMEILITDLGDGTEEVRAVFPGTDPGYVRLAIEVDGQTVRSAPFGWCPIGLVRNNNVLAPPFAREALHGGTFLPAADGFSLTDPTATWTPDQWLGHYAQITSGPATGALLPVSANSADTLIFDEAHPALAARLAISGGGNYVLRPQDTPASLFGRFNESGLAVGGGTSSGTVFSHVLPGGSFEDFYFRGEGIGGVGWRSLADPFTSIADRLLTPGEGLIINHPEDDGLALWFHGEVILGQRLRPMRRGVGVVGSQSPIDERTLDTLGVEPFFLVTPDGYNDSNFYISNPWGGIDGHFLKDASLPGGTGWRRVWDPFTPVGGTPFGPAPGWLYYRFEPAGTWEHPQPFAYPE